jgi:hypothetical protein
MVNDGSVVDGYVVIVVYSVLPLITSKSIQKFKHRFSNEPEHLGGYATVPIDHPEAKSIADNLGCNLWLLLQTKKDKDSKCLSLKHCAILCDVKDPVRKGFLVSSRLTGPKRESQKLWMGVGVTSDSKANKEPPTKKAHVCRKTKKEPPVKKAQV